MPPLFSLTSSLSLKPVSPSSFPSSAAQSTSSAPASTASSAVTDAFTSDSLWTPCGARGVFGGQVIAQALCAATRTVGGGMSLHSQHCYFLLPAASGVTITYNVERLRDGRSYATRLVKAYQSSKPVFILIASYASPPSPTEQLNYPSPPFSFIPDPRSQPRATPGTTQTPSLTDSHPPSAIGTFSSRRDEPPAPHPHSVAETELGPVPHKISHSSSVSLVRKRGEAVPFSPKFQIPFPPDVEPFDEAQLEETVWRRNVERNVNMANRSKTAIEDYIKERQESPVGIAMARRRNGEHRNTRSMWLKARLGPDERLDEDTIKAMFAYMTDFQFIGTAGRAVGLTWASKPRIGMLASLDHTTHFYPLPPGFDPSSPLLHTMEAAITDVPSGRGVVRGLLYTADGVLVANTVQEGVVRADFGKGGEKEQGRKGLVEGGAVGQVHEDEGGHWSETVKAKL